MNALTVQPSTTRLGLLLTLGLSLVAIGCDKDEDAAAADKDGPACFMFAKEQKDRWTPYESLVKDAGVCMFNKDEKSFSMRSLYDAPPAKPEEVAKRFQKHFEDEGFEMDDQSKKPGVIVHAYDKGDKTYLVVTHMTDDEKKVDNTVVEYKAGALPRK
jgi:hypothetical protein